MTTAIVTNSTHSAHDDAEHVEQAARLRAIDRAIGTSGLRSQLLELAAPPASAAQVAAAHHPRVLEALRAAVARGGGWFDQDTYCTAGSLAAALEAAGGAVRGIDVVAHGQAANAFALVRPPGHHATPERPMGFCLLNNIAIAARYATTALGFDRVAIVDYDVHHGNGTQACFYDDPQVLFCSTHAAPLYPETGDADEYGSDSGYGYTLNIPLPHGSGDRTLQLVFDELILPALHDFVPQLILVSAGYDGHWADPLGPFTLSTSGYARITRRLADAAQSLCGGRIVLILEGGYDLDALGECVVGALRALVGVPAGPDKLGFAEIDEPNIDTLLRQIKHHHPLFQSLWGGWM